MVDLKVIYHDPEMPKLEHIKGEVFSTWVDLRNIEEVELKAGEFKLIDLGISVELPYCYEAIIAPRSSTFMKYGIIEANGIGIIDTAYCGDNDIWKFPAYATRDIVIPKYTRICQFRIQMKQPDCNFISVDHLNHSNRGGFGSTGEI